MIRILLGMLLLSGCEDRLTPIPNTTTRVEKPVVEKGTELALKIFTTQEECAATVQPDEIPLCMPYVDRANGEVRVGFQFRLDGEDFPLPLSKEHLRVGHLGQELQDGGDTTMTVVPHDPIRSPQLFVLLIDGSSSMGALANSRSKNNRLEEVRQALLSQDVVDAFFPGDVKTRVVVFQFTQGRPVPLGGVLQVLENQRQYRKLIRQQLRVRSGYTHLYDAIAYTTGDFLNLPAIKDLLELYEMTPTIVALTDGFNNMAASDTCATNAARLSNLLEHLERVRSPDDGADPRRRPSVYTVGLGRPLRARFKLPKDVGTGVRSMDLCGKRFRDRRIDGDLENRGIDNASLEWIARIGGGASYVRQDQRGLGEAFKGAAAERYTWFESRYRIDPYYLRRKFKTTLRLVSFATAEASVVIHPNAWLDAPPGMRDEQGWTIQRPYTFMLVVLVPAFGLLLWLSYMGGAVFNAKRAMFMRVRRPRGSNSPSHQGPPEPPPTAHSGPEV
ncbi:MAG: hypothetical protein CL930_12840 [Deltaproteobacteria bacterium]|nr:hypothetical protein [Deltaproteobacteria bacterium]